MFRIANTLSFCFGICICGRTPPIPVFEYMSLPGTVKVKALKIQFAGCRVVAPRPFLLPPAAVLKRLLEFPNVPIISLRQQMNHYALFLLLCVCVCGSATGACWSMRVCVCVCVCVCGSVIRNNQFLL